MRVLSNKGLYNKVVNGIEPEPLDSSARLKTKAISFDAEDLKGQQTIDLSRINLCPDLNLFEDVSVDNVTRAIIEFGDEYTMGDAVDFTWNVKTGDELDKDTILAYAGPNSLPVRSIFSKGIVSEDTFFKGYANRHIVVKDYELNMDFDYKEEDVSTVVNKFAASDIMYNFII